MPCLLLLLQVRTVLENPTRYHVIQKQKNQVRQYLSESFQQSEWNDNQQMQQLHQHQHSKHEVRKQINAVRILQSIFVLIRSGYSPFSFANLQSYNKIHYFCSICNRNFPIAANWTRTNSNVTGSNGFIFTAIQTIVIRWAKGTFTRAW